MTDIQIVRLLIGDTSSVQFVDPQIQTFLAMSGGSLFLAAALALESWASTLTGATESEHIGDYSYSKKEVSNKLDLAKRYRDNESVGIVMDIASMNLTAGSAITAEED